MATYLYPYMDLEDFLFYIQENYTQALNENNINFMLKGILNRQHSQFLIKEIDKERSILYNLNELFKILETKPTVEDFEGLNITWPLWMLHDKEMHFTQICEDPSERNSIIYIPPNGPKKIFIDVSKQPYDVPLVIKSDGSAPDTELYIQGKGVHSCTLNLCDLHIKKVIIDCRKIHFEGLESKDYPSDMEITENVSVCIIKTQSLADELTEKSSNKPHLYFKKHGFVTTPATIKIFERKFII